MHLCPDELPQPLFVVCDVSKEIMDMSLKLLEAVPAPRTDDVLLHEVPEPLNEVQVRRVGRQEQ